MECKNCGAHATWRIHSETKGFGSRKGGGSQRNVYACDVHKKAVQQQVKAEMKDDLVALGDPFSDPDPVVASPA